MTVTPIRQRRAYPNWLHACQTDSNAEPRSNVFNAVLALRNDPDWVDALGFDQMLQVAVLRAANTAITDADVNLIHLWMQEHGIEKMGIDAVREAIDIVAREHAFHPLRDELNQFAYDWDGDHRNEKWLTTYFGADKNDYTEAVGQMFLRAMAARIYQPGCKADYMLVLEGPQGKTKSMAIAALAGEYFSDTLPPLDKDPVRVSMHLRGKWLTEVADLSSFNRTATNHLKAFLTTRIELYTPKYGRNEVREPRTCLFIGTTNKHAYLLDETGGRRFWPVVCGKIDVEALKRDRPQLLGEAVNAYRGGAPWWPDPAFEEQHIAPVQAARYDGDSWEQAIEDWDRCTDWFDPNAKTTIRVPLAPPLYLADIALGALMITKDKLSKRDEQRLITVLEIAGWSRSKHTRRGTPWFPP